MIAPHEPATSIDIDERAIERYVNVVFGYLEGYVPVRALAETGTPDQPPHSTFPITCDLSATLKRLAGQSGRDCRGLYVVPGTVRAQGSAKAADIVSTSVVLIDLDKGDIAKARDHLTFHLGAPTMEIASGGRTDDGHDKLHLYWRLTEAATAEDVERVRAVRQIIAVKAGGDASFDSMHQPIRVPGTIHAKHGIRSPVRLLDVRPIEYDLTELALAAQAMPSLAGSALIQFAVATGPRGPTAGELATHVIREGGVDEVTRFEALSKVIGHWLRNARNRRCTLEEAWQAVDDHNMAMMSPPWEVGRLRHEFQALLARDIAQLGPMPAAAIVLPANTHVPLSDDALAAAFVAQDGSDWRHVADWGKWLAWSGCCWVSDRTGQVRERVRLVCRSAALVADKPNDARRIASDKTIAAVLRIAACDPAVSIAASAWDSHPLLLNTPSGVADLETGEIGEHDRSLLLTQMTKASPGSGCPRWPAFLDEITGGDVEICRYLQRLAGYVLTGSTAEQVFVFFYGSGANGKSVFVQTLAAVLGDYAATATLDTFMASQSSRHLTELAGLRAARLVVVPETEAGRAWSEARIKTVTGGEKIRANFMHRDHFEFQPQFKLLVAGNHRPGLSNVGEAMRRRLHMVPFDVTIPAASRDIGLQAKLLAERDGILGWMLEGCAEWRRIGLAPPPAVLHAAQSYFADEDLIGQWIDACCQLGPDRRSASHTLFGNWSLWTEAGGHAKGTSKLLGEALRQRGYRAIKVGGQRGWLGIELRRHAPGPEDEA